MLLCASGSNLTHNFSLNLSKAVLNAWSEGADIIFWGRAFQLSMTQTAKFFSSILVW